MQAYRGLPILTNQDERHTQLVGIWPLDHEGSVAEYQRLAHEAIDGVLAQERLAVVVGGTGLYLRAAVSNLELPPPPDAGVRERLEAVYERVGGERAHALLAERDPPAAAHVHPNDRRRVVRALELVEAGASLRPEADRLWSSETRHPTLFVGLDVPREELARRIDTRTQAMFERGVEEEARRALESAISATASMIVGLREIAELPREQAAEAIALRTRRYAAYQRKWMRRIPGLVTVRGGRPAGEIADEILQVARARQHVPAGHGG